VTDIFIEGGRALLGGEIHETSLQIAGGKISAVGSEHGRGSLGLDAGDWSILIVGLILGGLLVAYL